MREGDQELARLHRGVTEPLAEPRGVRLAGFPDLDAGQLGESLRERPHEGRFACAVWTVDHDEHRIMLAPAGLVGSWEAYQC